MPIEKPNNKIHYKLRTSKRAKYMRIAVYPGGSVVVTVPTGQSLGKTEYFIQQKSRWILTKLLQFGKSTKPIIDSRGSKSDFQNYKLRAREIVSERVGVLNFNYNFSYNRISIRNGKTRWGSCSRKGNLNFNYKILFLPPSVRDYIITHELCHLKEFNHSKGFWALVARTQPNYKQIRHQLKSI